MAEVKSITAKVEKVTIELTADEAQVVYDLCINTGGDPVYSRRKFTDAISAALRKADPNHFNFGQPQYADLQRDPHFNDIFPRPAGDSRQQKWVPSSAYISTVFDEKL